MVRVSCSAGHHHIGLLDHLRRKRHHERHRLHLPGRAIKDHGKGDVSNDAEITVSQGA